MNLEELKKEYATQDNRCTAYPIFVTVQEKKCLGVFADGYSPCGVWDCESQIEYCSEVLEDCEPFEDKEELINQLEEYFEDDPAGLEDAIEDIQALNFGYGWVDIEWFLTIKGAKEFIKADKHNHGELRTFVYHFDRRNFEMNELMEHLGFKTKDTLTHSD